ncbi:MULTISPECIES: cytochrome c oxidase assembly factor Coa1 family protein [unclassified Arcicella]|uniref:RDD family protein n=1 Tax=unclassified Arcicella TaxID=2644986 RepID=UPI00286405CE|nr:MULTISPECIES: cytochrome c oxidase assembly factor Coa1 family protein [unclassified Arcicella]MDR6561814.1 putative RDD family membrane protein YckC [Arcicella sp. BE51]MDR6813960.1 putative RDD family membrane protein YckC [Arcicella sp. BE140]MDR6825333.1 putative RDD family membrane protein YckC [Arcicella sp. BE139]
MPLNFKEYVTLSSRKRRIAAFMIDHFVMSTIGVLIFFLTLGPDFMNENSLNDITIAMSFVMLLIFVLYFAKDSVNGISIGRWIMGIMVRDEEDSNIVPSFGRLFLRNLFLIIWPVEFIVLATSNVKKRLGDKVLKTIVIRNPDKPKTIIRILAVLGTFILFFVIVLLLSVSTIKKTDAYKMSIIGIEQNKEIQTEIGGIKEYGMFPTGNVNITNGHGQADLQIKVIGNQKEIEVNVYLEKEPNSQWKIIEMKK